LPPTPAAIFISGRRASSLRRASRFPLFAGIQRKDLAVLVRPDGTVFFATAFAWENGTLRYITSEGLRHTLTADKLDLDATQQFNEQRGLTFRSPV